MLPAIHCAIEESHINAEGRPKQASLSRSAEEQRSTRGCRPAQTEGLCLCRQVLIVWFGEFPEVPRGFPRQAFSILMAITGLAAFAIVLALVEQLVLQILTENVSRGSQVYEEGHILVLAWAETQRDREVIWKILSQVRPHCPCCAGVRACSKLVHCVKSLLPCYSSGML